MKNWRLYFLIILFIGVFLSISHGQDQPPFRGRAAERVEQFKKMRLMEALQLNEETSIRFMSRYNKHMDAMRDIGKERNDLIDELEKLTRAKANDSELEKVIIKIGMSEETIAAERSKFISGIKDILTIKQIAAYVVFERNFNRNLRELMKDIAKDRWDARK